MNPGVEFTCFSVTEVKFEFKGPMFKYLFHGFTFVESNIFSPLFVANYAKARALLDFPCSESQKKGQGGLRDSPITCTHYIYTYTLPGVLLTPERNLAICYITVGKIPERTQNTARNRCTFKNFWSGKKKKTVTLDLAKLEPVETMLQQFQGYCIEQTNSNLISLAPSAQ